MKEQILAEFRERFFNKNMKIDVHYSVIESFLTSALERVEEEAYRLGFEDGEVSGLAEQ